MKKQRWLQPIFFLLGFSALLLSHPALAEEKPLPGSLEAMQTEERSAPVVLDGRTWFVVRGTSSIPADKRAQGIAERIAAIAADPAFNPSSLRLASHDGMTLLMAGDKRVMAITEADASLEGTDRNTLSIILLGRVKEAMTSWRHDRTPETLRNNGLFVLAASGALLVLLWGGAALFRKLRTLQENFLHQKIHDLRLKQFPIFRAQQIGIFMNSVLTMTWISAVLVLIYAYLSSVFTLFPWTRGLGNNLVALMLAPLKMIGLSILESIPDLIFLAVLIFVARYLLKMIQLFFAGVDKRTIKLEGFDAEWAWPTYRIIRMLLIAFVVVVAYPYIPGSSSEAFKGVSLFLGVIFSLGSTSLIGNLVAGYTMNYRRAFKVGDRVNIGNHLGDVEQVHTLVTHLRTPKNEELVIPNSLILSSEVTNYSTIARKEGLILHTTVGIGYETPWRQVHAMLIEAADRIPDLLKQPPPFVLQKGLEDFCVTYEINAYCSDPKAMVQLYTALHANILDVFNEYGVQIMTPAYVKDPEQPKLVPREHWFDAPARQS